MKKNILSILIVATITLLQSCFGSGDNSTNGKSNESPQATNIETVTIVSGTNTNQQTNDINEINSKLINGADTNESTNVRVQSEEIDNDVTRLGYKGPVKSVHISDEQLYIEFNKEGMKVIEKDPFSKKVFVYEEGVLKSIRELDSENGDILQESIIIYESNASNIRRKALLKEENGMTYTNVLYEYKDSGRTEKKLNPDKSVYDIRKVIKGSNGLPVFIVSNESRISNVYDSNAKLKRRLHLYKDMRTFKEEKFIYNSKGLPKERIELAVTQGQGDELTPLTFSFYKYDSASNLTRHIHIDTKNPFLSFTNRYGYDKDGRLTMSIEGGVQREYKYDSRGLLKEEELMRPDSVPQKLIYSCDKYGNVTRIVRSNIMGTLINEISYEYFEGTNGLTITNAPAIETNDRLISSNSNTAPSTPSNKTLQPSNSIIANSNVAASMTTENGASNLASNTESNQAVDPVETNSPPNLQELLEKKDAFLEYISFYGKSQSAEDVRSYLRSAVESATSKELQSLLESGTHIILDEYETDALSPIILAAEKGELEKLKLLIEYKHELNTDSFEWRSALDAAVENAHVNIVEFMLENDSGMSDSQKSSIIEKTILRAHGL